MLLLLDYLILIFKFIRSFIYTRRIKSERVVNILENSLAFIFCCVNGLQIGHYHTKFVRNSIFEWNFILGSNSIYIYIHNYFYL